MKKVLATIAMLAVPGMAMAAGLIGDCYDCHTMHNSESGAAVAQVYTPGTGLETSTNPVQNLLKLDCIACHANDPVAGDKIWTISGGSAVPQVAHGDATGDLAGGNFSYGFVGNGTVNKVHNVKELFAAGSEHYAPANGNPPGMVSDGGAHIDIFTTADAYDDFSCAGARGCHGTRNQALTVDGNGTVTASRVGMAAISGAHHINVDGAKDATNYAAGTAHSGAKVAEGYRFIPGLKGYGNDASVAERWQNIDANSHNEYYGNALGGLTTTGCGDCHTGGFGGIAQSLTTTMQVPNNSMSGFCSTCHGNFHSSGAGNDVLDNGVSGAFLRHPSDYVIPNMTEYAAYTVYDVSAPVARDTLLSAASATVTPGDDMVMCLSCHAAHGTPNDYILRFDYGAMTAGAYADLSEVDGNGDGTGGDAGCLACHTEKGIAR